MKKSRNYKPYSIIVILLVLIVAFALFFSSRTTTSIDIRDNDYKTLNYGWYTYEDGQKVNLDRLPTNVGTDSQGFSRIYIELGQDFNEKEFLLLRSSLQDISVYLDDELIYSHLIADAPEHMPMASLWHIVEIDSRSEGKILSIELNSPYERFDGVINDIHYGTTGELY